jgi:DNA repair ATPase RecN
MEMNDIQNSSKPTCLILDEVDGALGGSEGDSKGLQKVSEYLQRCIKAS